VTVPTDIFQTMAPRPYASLSAQIQDGDLLLFSQRDRMSGLIEWATKSPFSHIGFVLRLPMVGIMLLEALPAGVTTAALSIVVNGNRSGAQSPYKGGLLLARHDDFKSFVTDAKLHDLTEFAVDRLGAPFATVEIIKIALRILLGRLNMKTPRLLEPDDEYICSEYVAACYQRVGITIPWDRLGFIAPSDFAADPKVRPIGVIANA